MKTASVMLASVDGAEDGGADPAELARERVASSIKGSLAAPARSLAHPYRHWMLERVFPPEVARDLRRLPLPAIDPGAVSGKRELHNETRRYFDAPCQARFPVCAAIAGAFQSAEVVGAIERATGAELTGTFVRLEYAQDVDGFWLEPHTDLGVKKFTLLIYLVDGADQADLGTDMYADAATWVARPPFVDNTALMFVPAANTWHGLERRPIRGVRKSVIMNYVTDEWRARDQLSFSEPVPPSTARA